MHRLAALRPGLSHYWQDRRDAAVDGVAEHVRLALLTERTRNGMTGWSDTQEVQWGDDTHALRQDQE